MTESTEQNSNAESLLPLHSDIVQASKQETLAIFRELLERLWERIVGLIGETASVAIFRSALQEANHDHSLLQQIDIDHRGIHLERLQQTLDVLDRHALRAGLMAFTDNVMTLLIDLTGGILLRKVEPLLEQFKQKLDKT